MNESDPMIEYLNCGSLKKYFVIKIEDADKYLKDYDPEFDLRDEFEYILHTIALGRAKDGKKYNEYVVINTDEPYFEEIKAIMKRNGHWG